MTFRTWMGLMIVIWSKDKLSNTHDFKIFTLRYDRRSNMPDYQTNSHDLTMTRFCSNLKVLISSSYFILLS